MPATSRQSGGCNTEVKLHYVLSPLCSLSSLGPHDQSLFLLTELQTAWNQDEIGLQTEVKLSISSFPPLSVSPSPFPLQIFKKRMCPSMSSSPSAKHQSDYFWLSSSVTWTWPSGLPLFSKSIEVWGFKYLKGHTEKLLQRSSHLCELNF